MTLRPGISWVTTKSYINSKGNRTHHAKDSNTSVSFVGVDGEGITGPLGNHLYVLFGIGEEQIEDAEGLDWKDVFGFLYSRYKPATAYVGFFLGYDFTQIFKTLPEDKAWILLTTEGQKLRSHKQPNKAPHPVELDGWQFDILANKRLRIRPKTCDCPTPTCPCSHNKKKCQCGAPTCGKGMKPWMYVCDAGSFFQSSFLTVIDPKGWAPGTEVVSNEEFAIIEAGKEKRASATLDDEMRFYNRLENVILSRVMATLDRGFHEIGIHLPASKWFGPGQAASAWLQKEAVPNREKLFGSKREQTGSSVPVWFNEPARMAYFGGWFEQFIHGIIPGMSYEYDINSAYPSVIASLPCLIHGKYSRGNGIPDNVGSKDLVLVYAKVWSPNMPANSPMHPQYIGSMLHRSEDGSIARPCATEGWFWWHELQAAVKAGLVKPTFNRGQQRIDRWVKYSPCDCDPPMRNVRGLYDKRLEYGKKSPQGKAAKLVYNSMYGKFAQSVGEPIFGNAIYASLITAGCRTQILEAIASHPRGKANVAMVATDAVYFLDPHPGLVVSERLGEWDYQERSNLTLFKPGVYWDDSTRKNIAMGESPRFKARGFRAADFINSITSIDNEYKAWPDNAPKLNFFRNGYKADTWPKVEFPSSFGMVTALQALRRNDWSQAGTVTSGVSLEQNSNPQSKREGFFADNYNGRIVYRTHPLWNMSYEDTETLRNVPTWIPSEPYEKRFGLEDPYSDEYKSRWGETPDGSVADIFAWILNGE